MIFLVKADVLTDAQDTIRRMAGEPTKAQAESGNYPKKTIKWCGLTIKVENPAGSTRRGNDWAIRMLFDYGYIARTEGVDGDEVDVYLGPDLETAPMAYVVHQRKYGNWSQYDEDKVMLGFMSEESAREAYLQHYDDPRFLGPITAMPVAEFVEKVKATKESPKMIKSNQRVIFTKAAMRTDDHTVDLFGGGGSSGTHLETKTRKDGVVQKYRVGNSSGKPSSSYQSALDRWRAASAKFREATDKYRKREIGDDEYLAARKERDDARRDIDAAEATEKKPAKKLVVRKNVVENMKPPKLDKPIIEHNGDTWYILSTGVEREGKVFAHLSSTTRGKSTKNGVHPVQINDWVEIPGPETITEPRSELIAEHERLVDVLESPSHKDDRVEAKRQAGELAKYRSGKPTA